MKRCVRVCVATCCGQGGRRRAVRTIEEDAATCQVVMRFAGGRRSVEVGEDNHLGNEEVFHSKEKYRVGGQEANRIALT